MQALPNAGPGSKGRHLVQPHALETHSPALLGPVAAFQRDAGQDTSHAPVQSLMTLRSAALPRALRTRWLMLMQPHM